MILDSNIAGCSDAWTEAQSWNGTTLRATDGRRIIVLLTLDSKVRASNELAAKIEKHIPKTR